MVKKLTKDRIEKMSFRQAVQQKWVSSFENLRNALYIFDTSGVWIVNTGSENCRTVVSHLQKKNTRLDKHAGKLGVKIRFIA